MRENAPTPAAVKRSHNPERTMAGILEMASAEFAD